MSLSPQSQKLYQLLVQAEKPQSIKQIATKLKIVPNSVYRLAQTLIKTGLIEKKQSRPATFIAKPTSEAMGIYLLNQASWFQDKFTHKSKKKQLPPTDIELSFIQGRDDLMQLSVAEIDQSHKSIDLLRSGHEMPAEVMRAMIHARQRGVISRMMIQEYNKKNTRLVSAWQKNGIQVRYTTTKHLRLMIYDNKILYFMSYKHHNSQQDMGMKITHSPFASMLSQVFEQLWQRSDIL